MASSLTVKPDCFPLAMPPGELDDADHCISTVDYSEATGLLAAAHGPEANVAIFDINQLNDAPAPTLATWKAHSSMLSFCRFLKDNSSSSSNNNNNGGGGGGGEAPPPKPVLLATASEDGLLKIWDVRSIIGQQQQAPQNTAAGDTAATFGLVASLNTRAEINCFVQSTDGNKIYCGCEDGSVVVFNSNGSNQDGAPADRFIVSEGAVNDMVVADTPYGDLLFTGTDDGSLRCWRTFPGQRAPKEAAALTAEEIRQKLREQNQEEGEQQQQQEGGEGNATKNDAGPEEGDMMRRMIVESLGDEACNRLLTSFDALQGQNAINHLLVSDLASGQPHIFLSCGQIIFSVAFDVDTGALSEMPSMVYEGHQDFVRGLHAMGRGAFWSVGDDGAVCMFSRAANLESPVAPLRRFLAEPINIMASVFVAPPQQAGGGDNKPTETPVLVTGALNGALKLWKLTW